METIQKYLITCLIAEEERETKGDLPCLNFFLQIGKDWELNPETGMGLGILTTS